MSYSYPFLGLAAASVLWVLAGAGSVLCLKSHEEMAFKNPLAVKRSPYGALVAGLMKRSMHDYWHAGQSGQHAQHQRAPNPASREEGGAANLAWLNKAVSRLSALEEQRMLPTSKMPISNAHKRYLDAAANAQLRAAYWLDPGDAALYEISHYAVMASAENPETGRIRAEQLAAQTIEHALSDQGGMSAALTGAGAAINLLNNDMVAGSGVAGDVVLGHWALLSECLKRYALLRGQAAAEGWWEEIPEIRRGEIGSYAALVEKLAGTIKRRLVSTGILKE